GLMPAALATAMLSAISALMRAANSAGVQLTGEMPALARRSWTAGILTAFIVSALSLSTTAAGLPAGASIPIQIGNSALRDPASSVVGTSGSSGARVVPFVTNATSLPSRMYGSAVLIGQK